MNVRPNRRLWADWIGVAKRIEELAAPLQDGNELTEEKWEKKYKEVSMDIVRTKTETLQYFGRHKKGN